MPKHTGPGVFVVFEGIDGAGKSTQLRALAQALEHAGLAVVTSREPTDGPWGRKIRRTAAGVRMSLAEELDAFIQDRTEHAANLILPSLAAGKIVLLDRYYYSTMAYQGQRGADVAAIRAEMERRFPIPDAVILLDIPTSLALHRISQVRKDQPDTFEQQHALEAARAIFHAAAGDGVVKIIDATGDAESVHRRVLEFFINGPLKVRRNPEQWRAEESRIRPALTAQA
jgi:dTMP kinase